MRDDIRRAWVEALKRETDPRVRQWARRMLRGEPAPVKRKRRRQRKPAR
jgi:hypothetical protein